MMKISVVIPSFAEVDKEYLKLCVESLRATTDWQITVVTNGGRDANPLPRGYIDGISRHLHTRQQGQCNAVNVGAQMVEPDTDYIMVSNSDMYYAPGWNKNLRFDYPVFSPNLVEPTNNNGSAPPFLKVDGGFNVEEFDKPRVDGFVADTFRAIKAMEEPTEEPGFNLPFFIRKDVWQTIGGYDTKYDPFGSNSDTDLQTAINLAGIIPMRLRDVLVYHFSNKSGTFDFSQPGRQELWQKNFDYFTQKYGFNRDQLGSDVWYNKNMLPENMDDCKFQPDWLMKYG